MRVRERKLVFRPKLSSLPGPHTMATTNLPTLPRGLSGETGTLLDTWAAVLSQAGVITRTDHISPLSLFLQRTYTRRSPIA